MSEFLLSDWGNLVSKYATPHILQSDAWGELKSAFGWEPLHVQSGEMGVQILFRKLPLGLTIAYIPKPGLKIFSGEGALGEAIDQACRERGAIFLKVEPDAWEEGKDALVLKGWRPGKSIQPRRTILVDLRDEEDAILARMKQKTRYNIRLAVKKGVTVRPWDDLPAFHQMMQITGGRDEFGVHSLEYYRRAYELFYPSGMAELLVAEYEGKPLAALMVFARGKRAWYMYGASNNQERNRMPTYLLQWEAMRWAKAQGALEYDLWGAPDEDEEMLEAHFTERSDGLWGVYRFKRGFGGQVKRAVQALDRVYKPFLYQLYLWRMAGRENGS